VNKALDAAQKFMDDVKDAATSVMDAAYSGVTSIKDAWDNLDPGLKQWIVAGRATVVSFILAGCRRKEFRSDLNPC